MLQRRPFVAMSRRTCASEYSRRLPRRFGFESHSRCVQVITVTWTHVLQLLRVRTSKQRRQFARRCAENAWSTRELQRHIDRLGERRTYGGEKHEPPQSVDEALRVTARMAASWIRWVDVLHQ